MANAERCVCCGEIIPEGRMVCPNCEVGSKEKQTIPLRRRIIYAGDVFNSLMAEKGWSVTEASEFMRAFRDVDAVELPYSPRPMLKDRNPHNTDVYCPECGTNLSGYYGDEPLPIVTCFNCGEILDPCKATTKTDGERKYNG